MGPKHLAEEVQVGNREAITWLEDIDTFLIDCDGVLWKGDLTIEGAAKTLESIRASGKNAYFVTNNSSKSRKMYTKKLASHGISAEEGDIISTSYIAAAWLKEKGFDSPERKVMLIGEVGLIHEFEAYGINFVTPSPRGSELYPEPEDIDSTIGCVVVGLDRNFSYYKLAYAILCMQINPECLFVATNHDRKFPFGHYFYPGTGSLVECVSAACGRAPDYELGKPSLHLIRTVKAQYGLNTSRTCMIGDKLSTDIAFGKRGGMKTLLVLTGVTTSEELRKEEEDNNIAFLPDYVLPSISELNAVLR